MICSSIDVIVQAARLRDGSRRITHITEVMGMEGDVIITQDLVRLRHPRRGCIRQADRPSPLDRHRPAALLGAGPLLRRGEEARGRPRRHGAAGRGGHVSTLRTSRTNGREPPMDIEHGGGQLAWRPSPPAASPMSSSTRSCPGEARAEKRQKALVALVARAARGPGRRRREPPRAGCAKPQGASRRAEKARNKVSLEQRIAQAGLRLDAATAS